uniref:Candidate secreted effector n=1 Tax=Meloidogyne incognita TaxID=6306 RepID=A0A914KHH1_MELIC
MYHFIINVQHIFLIIIFFLINDWATDLSVNARFGRPTLPARLPAHPSRTFPRPRPNQFRPIPLRPNPLRAPPRGRPFTNAPVQRNFGVKGRNLPLVYSRKPFGQLRAPAAHHRPPASLAHIPLNLIFTPGAPGTG